MSARIAATVRWATAAFLVLVATPAFSLTVGGWTTARGGDGSILTGGDFSGVRNDLAAYFPSAVIDASNTLTVEYLSSIDVLMLDPVYSGHDVSISPLSSSEQQALVSWVSGWGHSDRRKQFLCCR